MKMLTKFLLALFCSVINVISTQQSSGKGISFRSLQNCAQNFFPSSENKKSAVCVHWPDPGSLDKDVISLTVTMSTSIQSISAELFSNLGLNLIELQLTKCNIQEISEDVFITLPQLAQISLSGNKLKFIPTKMFGYSNQIRKIDLSNNVIEKIADATFENLKNLNYLDLSGNKLSNIPANLPRSLSHLNIGNNLIHEIPTSLKLMNLEHLNLCQNSVNLNLDPNILSSSKIRNLCMDGGLTRRFHKEISKFINLQELTIRGPKSQNEELSIETLNSIEMCVKLEILKIERCDLDSLSMLKYFNNLKAVHLKEVFTKITPTVDDFARSRQLEILDLTGSQRLAESILKNQDIVDKFANVHTLILRNCALSNLNWLPNRLSKPNTFIFPQLKTVDISGEHTFYCDDPLVMQALCKFENLRKKNSPTLKIVNQNPLIIENVNLTYCQRSTKSKGVKEMMATDPIGSIPITDCNEQNESRHEVNHHTTDFIFDSVTQKSNFQPQEKEKNSGPNTDVIIPVVVVLLLLLTSVLILVCFLHYRKRQSQIIVSNSDGQNVSQSVSFQTKA